MPSLRYMIMTVFVGFDAEVVYYIRCFSAGMKYPSALSFCFFDTDSWMSPLTTCRDCEIFLVSIIITRLWPRAFHVISRSNLYAGFLSQWWFRPAAQLPGLITLYHGRDYLGIRRITAIPSEWNFLLSIPLKETSQQPLPGYHCFTTKCRMLKYQLSIILCLAPYRASLDQWPQEVAGPLAGNDIINIEAIWCFWFIRFSYHTSLKRNKS